MSDLNQARGSIYIDTSQPQTVPGIMQSVAQGINGAMSQVSAGTQQATSSFSAFAGAARGVAGAFGFSLGLQGLKQLADAAIAATETATAYNRQMVAARGLAGSQQELNHLLEVYQEASGGAVDKATALQNVTKLMSVGFADNAQELEKFTTIIRGISVAMGQSQDFVTQNLILELFSQRGARLDQLGLEYDKVKAKADQLAAADANLTAKQAYQNAVLDEAQKKFGKLAESPEAAKTGLEKAGSAAKDFGLTMGQFVGPTVNLVGEDVARTITRWNDGLQGLIGLTTLLGTQMGLIHMSAPTGSIASRSGLGAGLQQAPQAFNYQPSAAENAIRLDWAKGIKEQTQQANEQIQQANDDYQQQRLQSEKNFYKSSSDAAEDFARQRQREEQDLTDSISRLHRDSARREQEQAADLARGIADATTNSEEKIADARKDASERLVQLDEDYEKDRIKRAKELSDQLIEAAGNLDAKQVAELQRNAKRQEEEAKATHDDQRKEIQKQLQERIDDERKNLAKSIAQQQEAYDRQLQQSREADALRIEDMKADLKKRQDQEDIDYGIRMARAQRDHDDQLAEMDRTHGDRIAQIQKHGDEDLAALADQHKRQIDELLNHHSKYNDELKKEDDATLKEFARLTNPVRVWMHDPTKPLVTPDMAGTPAAYSVAPSSLGGNGGTTISRTVGNISFQIYAAPGQSPQDIANAVDERLREHLQDWAN